MSNNVEIYLLDTNSFTVPSRNYYAFDLVPSYWNELLKHINSGRIVILDIVKSEIDVGKDNLSNWLSTANNLTIVTRVTPTTLTNYQKVIQYISSCGLYKQSAFDAWAQNNVADPWLIASSKANGFTLVTEEKPSGGLSVKNKNAFAKIPDVASNFGVKTIGLFEMMRSLGISI